MFNPLRKLVKKVASNDKFGIRLLATMLVCYPEITTITYEPQNSELTLDFIIEGEIEGSELDVFMQLVDESIQTYHGIADGSKVYLAAEAESYSKDTNVIHLHRELVTITTEELSIIVGLFKDKYGKRIKLDAPPLEILDPDFLENQTRALEELLEQTDKIHINCRLLGAREENRVVVYNR